MKGKDNIEELFQKELGNYQAKVNPGLWEGVQAGINTSAAAGVGTSVGITAKVIIGVASAAAITIGTVFFVQKSNHPTKPTTPNEIQQDTVEKENLEAIDLAETQTKSSDPTIEKEQTIQDDLVNSPEGEENIETNTEQTLQESVQGVIAESGNEITEENSSHSSVSSEATNQTGNTGGISGGNMQGNSNHSTLGNQTENRIDEIDLSTITISVNQSSNQYIQFKSKGVPAGANVTWNFGDGKMDQALNPAHFYDKPGSYHVLLTVEKGDRNIQKEVEVVVKVSGKIENLPNIFTPNGDGRNDEFFVQCENIQNFQITIMDKQQNVVFSSNNPDFRWNGIGVSGNPVPDGIYIYIIVAEDTGGNKINKYQQLQIQR